MKMIATRKLGVAALLLCAAIAVTTVAPSTADASSAVRISQVYGGGGGSTGLYIYDYIELFNNSGASVVVPAGGWALMYGSATGTSFGSTTGNAALIPAGTVIPACGYLLIQCGTAGSGGVALPVTPDIVAAGPNISASTGKLALVDNQTIPGPLCSGNVMGMEPSPIIDAVGWGPTANCFEASVFPTATTNQQSVERAAAGATDSDNNASDFAIQGTPVPRNSSTAVNPACAAVPTHSDTWGRLKVLYR
jgi:hypothetical protein